MDRRPRTCDGCSLNDIIPTTNRKKPPKNRTCLICNLNFVVMLEKRKDDSESIQKFQGMLMAAVIGGLLLFIAPVLVVYIAGVDMEGHDTAEQALFALPESEGQSLPEEFTEKVNAIFDLVIWIARVIVVLFIVMAVIMLQMPRQTYVPAIPQKQPALISKPAGSAMRAVGTIFLIAIFTLVIFVVWFVPSGQDVEIIILPMLASCAASYGTFLYLDVRSTVSRGRTAVGLWEASPVFRCATKRWGFAVSVPLQVGTEAVLAVLVVPYYITMSFDVTIMSTVFAVFAAMHGIGWRINARSPAENATVSGSNTNPYNH